MDNRDVVLHFRVTPAEEARIQKKMEDLGIGSRSAYLRKMAMDGYCLLLDFDHPKQISMLLRQCSTALQDYVERCSEYGYMTTEDVQGLQDKLEAIWQKQKESLKLMAQLQ